MDGSSQFAGREQSLCLLQPVGTFLTALYRVKLLKVELALVLYMMERHLYNTLYQQYYYLIDGSYILRNTSFVFPNGTFCVSSEMIDNYTNNTNSYKEDESFSNHLVAYGQLANTIPSVLVALILGPLMDRYGRKIGIILPLIGKTLQGLFSVFIITYTLDPYYFVLAQFVGGLFGDFTCITAASFSYIADISSIRWRSLRIGVAESAFAYGGGIGTLLTGYWLRKSQCNFISLLWFYIGTNVFIGVYVVLLVPESLSPSERKQLLSKNKGPKAYIEGFRLYFGGLSLPSTWKLYVSTLVMIVAVLNIYGGSLIDVYFVKAAPFDLTTLQTGIYLSARLGSQGTADLLFLGLLVVLGASDTWVMLIAVSVHSICNVLVGLANKVWQLYASQSEWYKPPRWEATSNVAVVKGIEGIVWAGARGLVSKLVRPEQQGALFSIIASVDAVMHLAASSFWPLIFPLTLQHNMRSGMTYFFMAGLGFSILPVIMSLFLLKKEEPPLFRSTVDTTGINAASESSGDTTSDSSEEYKPLLTKSWTSNKVYGAK